MKVAIYSAVFGGYDPEPYDITHMQKENVEYWWITDDTKFQYTIMNGWNVHDFWVNPENGKYKYAKSNRFLKLQPHYLEPFKKSDINVYIDGNKKLFNIDMLLDYCQRLYNDPDTDAYFCKHTERDTVQQEVREICRLRRDEPSLVMRQYKEYREEGLPDDIPLIVASVQIRKTHAPALKVMLDCWWNEVKNKSYRDQISMPYAIWKTRFNRYKLLNVWDERLKMIANSNHLKVLNV